jgi:hypothetical protein
MAELKWRKGPLRKERADRAITAWPEEEELTHPMNFVVTLDGRPLEIGLVGYHIKPSVNIYVLHCREVKRKEGV